MVMLNSNNSSTVKPFINNEFDNSTPLKIRGSSSKQWRGVGQSRDRIWKIHSDSSVFNRPWFWKSSGYAAETSPLPGNLQKNCERIRPWHCWLRDQRIVAVKWQQFDLHNWRPSQGQHPVQRVSLRCDRRACDRRDPLKVGQHRHAPPLPQPILSAAKAETQACPMLSHHWQGHQQNNQRNQPQNRRFLSRSSKIPSYLVQHRQRVDHRTDFIDL